MSLGIVHYTINSNFATLPGHPLDGCLVSWAVDGQQHRDDFLTPPLPCFDRLWLFPFLSFSLPCHVWLAPLNPISMIYEPRHRERQAPRPSLSCTQVLVKE